MEEIQVNFKIKKMLNNSGRKKICMIERRIIKDGRFKLKHNNREVVKDVDTHGISYVNCKLHAWPFCESIRSYFPNFVSLQIKQCNLEIITKEHLREFYALRELFLNENKIQALPGDLFQFTPQLEIISFKGNRIKYIDSGIFAPLHNLRYFDLTNNATIDCIYDSNKSQSLYDMEFEIANRCKLTVSEVQHLLCRSEQSSNNSELMKKCENLQKQVGMKQKIIDYDQKQIGELKESVRYWMSLNQDFTISIDNKDFKVHKSVITNKSPLLKRLIDANSEAEDLELTDISVDTFKEILEFMYEKKFPHQSQQLVELYGASSRLEIKQLAEFASKKVAKTLDKNNCYEILKLSNKYNDETLRSAAFKEFKLIFPDQKFSDDLAKQPEALAKIMAVKKQMDEAFASLHL